MCKNYRVDYIPDDDILMELPHSVRRNWEHRFSSEYHPEMVLLSLEDWKSGKNDYSVKDISVYSKTQMMGLLERVGIINSSTKFDSIKKLEELPGERWVSSFRSSAFTYVFFVLLFLPKVIVFFFFVQVRDLLKNLRTSI